jgi:histidine kinase
MGFEFSRGNMNSGWSGFTCRLLAMNSAKLDEMNGRKSRSLAQLSDTLLSFAELRQFDVINIKGTSWIVIGDVSGHGVPAGLVMMMVQTSIHTALDVCGTVSPSEVLAYVNRTLYDNINKLGESKYMTMTLLSVQENGKLFFSGLHQDILIYRAEKEEVEPIETGIWIGLKDEIGELLEVQEFNLNSGDAMLLFTDGITEARDAKGTMFSSKKLSEVLKGIGSKSVQEIERGILDALQGYKCEDDVTFMVVKRI